MYAKDLRLPLTNAIDTNSVVIPNVKAGEMREAQRVLEELQINVQGKIADSGKEVWGNTHSAPQAVVLESRSNMQNFVPSVIGMGAKDAVYLLSLIHIFVCSLLQMSFSIPGRESLHSDGASTVLSLIHI